MTAVDNERYKSWSFTYRILKMSCSGVCLAKLVTIINGEVALTLKNSSPQNENVLIMYYLSLSKMSIQDVDEFVSSSEQMWILCSEWVPSE